MKRNDVPTVTDIASAIGKDRQTVARWMDEAQGPKGPTGTPGPVGVPCTQTYVELLITTPNGKKAAVKICVSAVDDEGRIRVESMEMSVIRMVEEPTIEEMEVALAQAKLDSLKKRLATQTKVEDELLSAHRAAAFGVKGDRGN